MIKHLEIMNKNSPLAEQFQDEDDRLSVISNNEQEQRKVENFEGEDEEGEKKENQTLEEKNSKKKKEK